MAIQFHQEMKDRDYPTKEPVRNPQQSNEQANPMGQLEKEICKLLTYSSVFNLIILSF